AAAPSPEPMSVSSRLPTSISGAWSTRELTACVPAERAFAAPAGPAQPPWRRDAARAISHRLPQRQWGEPGKVLHPDSIAFLESHSWPGNVPELENLIQREFILATDRVIRIPGIDQDDNEAEAHGAGNPPADMTFEVAKSACGGAI